MLDAAHRSQGAELPAGSITLVELLRDARASLPEAVNGLPVSMLGRVYAAFPAAFPVSFPA